MHSAPTSPGRRTLAVILAIIGVLAIIAGILYLAGAANSLHFMVGSVHKGHHLVRAAISFVAGVALLAGAWVRRQSGAGLPLAARGRSRSWPSSPAAAGVSAGIDMALTLLARIHGPQLAQIV